MSGFGWDFDKSGSGNKVEFTKFAPGVTNIRIVDTAPFAHWTHWQQKHKRSINCPGRGCPICEIRKQQKANKQPYTQAMARRLSIHIINRDTGKLEVLEQGSTFFQDLRDIMEDLQDKGLTLLDADIKVKRRGTGKDDTTYRLDLGEEYPLTDADKKLMESKVNFEDFYKPHTSEQIMRILNGEDWVTVMTNAESTSDSTDDSDEEEYALK